MTCVLSDGEVVWRQSHNQLRRLTHDPEKCVAVFRMIMRKQ
jgi:hypothetical protein